MKVVELEDVWGKAVRVRRCLSESGWVGRRLRESCSELEDVWVKAVELEDVWGKAVPS